MCGIFCTVVPHDPAIPRPDPLPDRLTQDLLEGRGPDLGGQLTVVTTPDGAGAGTSASFELRFLAQVLHLRGDSPEPQPAVDARGNVLLWNGEVFGGLEVPPGESDTSVVLRALAGDDSGGDGADSAILSTLSLVRGPWALLYYQRASRCLWFGRDCFGRRSLLWLFPEACNAGDGGGGGACGGGGGGTVDPRWFAISSVASQQAPAGARWSEVPADGVYKVHLGSGGSGGSCLQVEWFPWRWSPPELAPPSGVDGAARTTPDSQDDSCHCHSGSPLGTTPRPLGGSRGGETPTEEDGRAEELPPFFCVTPSKAYPGLRSFVPPMNMSVPQSPSPHPQAPHPQSPHPQDPHPRGPHLHGHVPPGPDVISERMVAARQLVEALDEAVRVRCIPENCGGGSGTSGSGGGGGGVGVADGSTDNGGGVGNAGGSTSGYGGHGGSIAGEASVAVLFSGGLDCMVLAALAHRHVPAHEPIDLLNVAFECRRRPPGGAVASAIGRHHRDHGKNSRKSAGPRKGDPPKRGAPAAQVVKDERSNGDGSAAPLAESGAGEETMEIGGRDGGPFDVPDRLSARAGLEELRTLFPHRRWRLLGVDVRGDELASARGRRIAHLVHPARSVLDDALGCALWFAARGRGQLLLDEGDRGGAPASEPGSPPPGSTTAATATTATTATTAAAIMVPVGPELFVSRAKVLLSGLGADEQLAGYSRHAARFRQGGWGALAAELRAELGRIGRRNLGRDDRVTADHGKEVRFPYLDEAVVSQLSALPAHVKADPGAARGTGDKLLLRQAALVHLGLAEASARPKRALQFGSRIAHMEGGSGGGPRERGSDSCSRLVQQHHPPPECV